MRLDSVSALWMPGVTVILILGLMACGGETATEDTSVSPAPVVEVEPVSPPPAPAPAEPASQPAAAAPSVPETASMELAPVELVTEPMAQVSEEPAEETPAEPVRRAAAEMPNEICPITGLEVDPNITVEIDGQQVRFATVEARQEFIDQLGKDD
ncbi:hypothetical protein JXA47_01670 [Candidatus Sumerlaeota bacterium]|nr:hypothetical protein [Candidatus Sumerlaeota bacterium]